MYISGGWLKSSLCNFVCRSESHSILDSKSLGSHFFKLPTKYLQHLYHTFLKILLIQNTPPRLSEISMKNWRAKVKPVLTPYL